MRIATRLRVALASLVVVLALSSSARATDIWMAATEPAWRSVRNWPANDWMGLFQPGARWQAAAAQVRVFELSKRAVLEMSDADLAQVVGSLRQRHIRLSVQGTPLLASQACGLGVEGHGPPNDMQQVALRLKHFGADLAYIDMDEPLWFGHFYNGVGAQRSCHNSIAEVARQTAIKLREVRQIYPQIVFGEDEPIGVPDAIAQDWPENIREWLEAYRTAMGEPMGFFHADMVWQRRGWQAILPRVEAVVRQERVSFGVIYNGTPADPTDASWIDDAVTHFEEVEGSLHIRPDQAMLQSWMDHPRAILPETDPSAMTNLVLRYSDWLTRRH